jgi:hypothetical protein
MAVRRRPRFTLTLIARRLADDDYGGVMSRCRLALLRAAAVSTALTSAMAPAFSQPAADPQNLPTAVSALPFRDPYLPIAVRVDDLVSRMTLEEKVPQMMHAAPAIPRLGIPAYNWWSEGLHGVAAAGIATVFPQAIGMAASFDPGLLHTEADIIATEFRAKYNKELRTTGHTGWFHGLGHRRDNLAPDGRLTGDVISLPGNALFHFLCDRAP